MKKIVICTILVTAGVVSLMVSNTNLAAVETDFGFKPSTSLKEGLRKFAEWYREYKIDG